MVRLLTATRREPETLPENLACRPLFMALLNVPYAEAQKGKTTEIVRLLLECRGDALPRPRPPFPTMTIIHKDTTALHLAARHALSGTIRLID